MSYATRKEVSSNRTASIIIVALLHVVLGYALVTGLAYNVIKKAAEDLKTFDVEEEPPPPPEEPPPPPEQVPDVPPPPVAPPPIVRTNTPAPPVVMTTPTPPPITPPVVAPPPPPPPPPVKVQPAKARANLASYVSDDDYPQSAIRNEEQGTTGFRLDVGPDGRVTNCTITSSSGSVTLDNTTCNIMRKRARFTPASDASGGKVADSVSGRIRWVLPEE